jgi:hypothetical protein
MTPTAHRFFPGRRVSSRSVEAYSYALPFLVASCRANSALASTSSMPGLPMVDYRSAFPSFPPSPS